MSRNLEFPEILLLRTTSEMLKAISTWAKRNRLSRSEAIRRLLEQALAHTAPMTPRGKEAIAKATNLAQKALDKVVTEIEPAPPEEQERRKRRLLKGPKEFRDIRNDVSRGRGKAKQ